MNSELKNKINKTINSIMGIDVSTIETSAKLNTIPEWDSFNNLMLISKFQDEFNVEFTAIEIEETQTIDAIFNLIEKKIAKKNG
jgi:acyl carrier protein